jgi:hypothetical protein
MIEKPGKPEMIRIGHTIRHLLIIIMITSIFIPLSVMYGRYKPFSKVFHVFNQKDDTPKLARRLNSVEMREDTPYLSTTGM